MYLIAVFTNPRALGYIATDLAEQFKGKVRRKDVMKLSQVLADHTYKIRGVFVLKLQCEKMLKSIENSAVATYKVENYELIPIDEPNAIYRPIAEEARMPTYNFLALYRKEALEQ